MDIQDELSKLQIKRKANQASIDEMKKQISALETENFKIDTKIEIYNELLDQNIGKKKMLNDEQLIEVATDVIKHNPKMKRVNQIVKALIAKNFEFETHEIATRMLKTKKFEINKVNKCWETVGSEDEMFK